MRRMKAQSNEKPQIPEWIIVDLKRSGLAPDDIDVEPLHSKNQLESLLGYSMFNGKSILEVGGYFIPYPNAPDYCRLKLKEPIGKAKYLWPVRNLASGITPTSPKVSP